MEMYCRYAKLFVRFAVALVTVWWISARLPLAGEFLRRVSAVLTSPLFVFVLCHVIVVSLVVDSGKLSLRNRTNREADGRTMKSESEKVYDTVRETETDEIVFVDKEVISETKSTTIEAEEEAPTLLRRWRSEKFEREASEPPREREHLRRSESEKCFDVVAPRENVDSRDELSDEDFNRKVEAFIAKQLKFHRQEHVFRAASDCENSPEVSNLCQRSRQPLLDEAEIREISK